jgi:hypothetical protein
VVKTDEFPTIAQLDGRLCHLETERDIALAPQHQRWDGDALRPGPGERGAHPAVDVPSSGPSAWMWSLIPLVVTKWDCTLLV